MKAEYQVSNPKKIDELKNILFRFNPFNEDLKPNDAYLYLSTCLYDFYFSTDKDDRDERASSFLKDILISCDKEIYEKLLFEILNLFDKWDYERNSIKIDEKTLNRIKTYAKENRDRKRNEFYMGLVVGLLVMFLIMLKVILEIR